MYFLFFLQPHVYWSCDHSFIDIQCTYLGGFATSPSPSPEASAYEDGDDADTNSSSDDEMTSSQ